MKPQELKNSILQLAIQGKLVEQRREEGTAEELYQQIQAERKKLIKEGKIKKETPLPEITEDAKPFDIPDNWKWMRLDPLSIINGGYAFKSTDFCNIGTRVIRISDFNENGFVNAKIVRHPFHEEYSPFLLEPENILLCMTGGTVGKCLFVKKTDEPMMVNQRVATIKILQVFPLYVYYNIIAPYIQSIIQKSKNSTNDNISIEAIKNFIIPLPPLAEQKRIVAKIEELLPLIDRYEKAWCRLEEFNRRFPDDMQKSILQMAIQGKLVEQRLEEGTGEELYQQIQAEKQKPIKEGKIKKEKSLPEITEDEKPFDIPESWKWAKFLSVVEIATNLVQPNKYQEFKHIAPDNIEKGTGKLFPCRTVAEDKVASANHLFSSGQILYSKIRPLLRKAVIAPFDGLCSADMYPLQTHIESRFLLYFLLSDAFNHQIAEAMSSRVKMPKINQDELSRVYIPLPPLAEQKRIVAKIEELIPLSKHLMIVNNRESL